MTIYRCQLIRITEGFFSSRLRPVAVGDPVVFDVDLGQGGERGIRDVILALARQTAGGGADASGYRLRVWDMMTGELISDFGVAGSE